MLNLIAKRFVEQSLCLNLKLIHGKEHLVESVRTCVIAKVKVMRARNKNK